MKKLKRVLFLLICALIVWTNNIQASDLYATEVRVANESSEERSKGLVSALAIVIKKVSGDPKVVEQNKIAAALSKASSFVQQFRYRVELGDTIPGNDKPVETRYLWAKFDKTSIDNLLQQANINVWAQNRPKILLWLAIEQQGQRRLFDLNETPENLTTILNTAKSRGIPLQLPLLDLQDQAKLQTADLWAGFEGAIRSASERYPHDAILVGRLRQLDEQLWSTNWSLFGQNEKHDFAINNIALAQALSRGLNDAQDRLAAKHAPQNTAPVANAPINHHGALLVRFSGIDSLRAYSRLMSIVKRQNEVNRFKLYQISGDSVLFEVLATTNPANLASNLAATGQLVEIQVTPTPDEPVDFAYRLVNSVY